MQKRHVVVGMVMFLASAVSYGLVQMTEASPATLEAVEVVSPTIGVTAAASPVVLPSSAFEFVAVSDSTSDAAMLFATGATLLGLAAGVRRHTC